MIHPIEQYAIEVARQLRKKHNLTQRDLAKILNTLPSFIGNIESPNHTAKYNIIHLNTLAAYFGISPKDFLPDKAYKS